MKIRFTPESIDDLSRLHEFIAVKNPLAAKKVALQLLAGIEKLKIFPNMGLPVERAPDPEKIRDLFVGDYTVRYLVGNVNMVILRIWHGKEAEKD
ncbi:MAG: type II toxin-antitoxin system RelE/ParE family toxin [Halioglobus sp.]|nr:type II toxin-antitoxin system RelE/ParE family toxin [Halioglobus sp.]